MNFTNYESFQQAFTDKFLGLWDSPEITTSSDDSLYSESIYVYNFRTEQHPNNPEGLLISEISVEFTFKTRDYSSDDWEEQTSRETIDLETFYHFLTNRLSEYETVTHDLELAFNELMSEYNINKLGE